ncbi:unnamed protein product [Mycena citricolor]|uniref:Uncharacterized protein n=1 Tax=Mycena citricolor TaxID=2018698 RepID=A0AAD2K747_9AGAR|nr:unnamed protein product [Mycena citricolor]
MQRRLDRVLAQINVKEGVLCQRLGNAVEAPLHKVVRGPREMPVAKSQRREGGYPVVVYLHGVLDDRLAPVPPAALGNKRIPEPDEGVRAGPRAAEADQADRDAADRGEALIAQEIDEEQLGEGGAHAVAGHHDLLDVVLGQALAQGVQRRLLRPLVQLPEPGMHSAVLRRMLMHHELEIVEGLVGAGCALESEDQLLGFRTICAVSLQMCCLPEERRYQVRPTESCVFIQRKGWFHESIEILEDEFEGDGAVSHLRKLAFGDSSMGLRTDEQNDTPTSEQ